MQASYRSCQLSENAGAMTSFDLLLTSVKLLAIPVDRRDAEEIVEEDVSDTIGRCLSVTSFVIVLSLAKPEAAPPECSGLTMMRMPLRAEG